MKKLVSAIACFSICFAIQAQTQLDKPQDGNGKAGIVKTGDATQTQGQQSYELKDAKTEVAPQTTCPKAATCQKTCQKTQADAQAAGNQGEVKKPCCAKHQATQAADAEAKTEQKAGCNHQNADQKAKCNHGSEQKSTCPQKK